MNHLDLLATEAAEKLCDSCLHYTDTFTLRAFANTEASRLILTALTTAYNSGKVEGVEQAAKVAEAAKVGTHEWMSNEDVQEANYYNGHFDAVAAAIRKLIEKGEKAP